MYDYIYNTIILTASITDAICTPLADLLSRIVWWLVQLDLQFTFIKFYSITVVYWTLLPTLILIGIYYQFKVQCFYYFCKLCEFCSRRHDLGHLRMAFRDHPLGIAPRSRDDAHPHPFDANSRTAATNFINSYGSTNGLTPYSISMSTTEQREGVRGVRMYHTTKDLAMSVKKDPVLPTDLVRIVDVDYYLSERELFSCNPTILYTFQPSVLSNATSNHSWHFEGNEVITKVVGGSTYRHHVWDWSCDSINVLRWWGMQSYLIDHRFVTDNRFLVLITPVRSVFSVLGWLLYFFDPQPLRPLVVGAGTPVLRLDSVKDGVNSVSLMHRDSNVCVNLTLAQLRAMQIKWAATKTPQMGTIERILLSEGRTDHHVETPLMYEILSSQIPLPVNTQSLPEVAYTPVIRNLPYSEEGKPVGRHVLTPYIDVMVAPTRSISSDASIIDKRIKSVASTVETVPAAVERFAGEFIEHLIPEPGIFVPESLEEAEAKQQRPTQVSLWMRARMLIMSLTKFTLTVFMKSEGYAKFAPPRNITVFPDDCKIPYACYMYSLSHALKNTDWYAFSKTPREISARMHDICADASVYIDSDYSKFDGTISPWMRRFERAVLLRAFPLAYHRELFFYWESQMNARAWTKFGLDYTTGTSRLSGSPETSVFNSIDNALVAYISLRKSGLTPSQAWKKLGIYGGDDGGTPDLDPDIFKWVCKKVGLVVKINLIKRFEPVTFLGRTFTDPWTHEGSMIDFLRCFSKLTFTVSPNDVSTDVVMWRKAMSLWYTDRDTPVLGLLAKRILQFTDPKGAKMLGPDSSWMLQQALHAEENDAVIQMEEIGPIYEQAPEEEAWDIITKTSGFDRQVLNKLCDRIRSAECLEDMFYCIDDERTPDKGIECTWRGELMPGDTQECIAPPSKKVDLKKTGKPDPAVSKPKPNGQRKKTFDPLTARGGEPALKHADKSNSRPVNRSKEKPPKPTGREGKEEKPLKRKPFDPAKKNFSPKASTSVKTPRDVKKSVPTKRTDNKDGKKPVKLSKPGSKLAGHASPKSEQTS